MKNGSLTQRQSEALRFIKSYRITHQESPSYQDIMEALNITSKSNVNRLVRCLRQRGYIDYLPGHARSIIVL